MDLSLRVMKEPRGFMRIIQCVMAIFAFSTTAGFSTECKFNILCNEGKNPIAIEYDFGYPFSNTDLEVFKDCDDSDHRTARSLPFDFSNAAEFYVTTGVLSFLYTIAILVVYTFFHQTYTSNPKLPVVDLGVSAVLAVFWMAGSSAWAQGVTDLKYYLHPSMVFKLLDICDPDHCETVEDGSYGVLNGSLVLGFANFLLWTCSLWFIYKETVFHTPEVVDEATQNQAAKGVGRV